MHGNLGREPGPHGPMPSWLAGAARGPGLCHRTGPHSAGCTCSGGCRSNLLQKQEVGVKEHGVPMEYRLYKGSLQLILQY